jgi:hypothetical protein
MTASRDPDRLIRAFLKEGLDELPDPVYDAVRDRIEQTRQRAVIGPWRRSDMNRYLKIGLAAAAVLVIAVVGIQLFGGPDVGGPAPTETPQPSSTPTPTSTPTAGGNVPGLFALLEGPVPIEVTIAASGWFGNEGMGILIKNDSADSPDGSAMIVFEGPLYVYGDPCRWSTTTPDTPASTVDELVAALAAQASRDASAPVDITLDGYAGKSITLHVPDDAVFSDCDQGFFGSWTTPGGGGPLAAPERYHQGPGQIDELWIVDVGGVVIVIDSAYYGGTPADDVAELRAIVESATFGQ